MSHRIKKELLITSDVVLQAWPGQIVATLERLADDFDIFRKEPVPFVTICISALLSLSS